MSKTMILRPRVSEKAYELSQNSGVYVIEVPKSATKQSVTEAIKSQFEVTPTSVNVTNIKGKVKRSYRKRGGRSVGRTNDIKKAYITLKKGDSIAIFPKEEEKKDAKPEQTKSKKATRSVK